LDAGPDWRGGQEQVLHLVVGLARRGVEQRVAVREQSALALRLAQTPVPLIELPFRSELDLASILKLRKLIKDFQPSVIHAHDSRTLGLAVAARLAGSRPKLVAARRVAFALRANPFSRFKYRKAPDRILAVSEFIRSRLVASGVDSRRVTVIYDGFDWQAILPGANRTDIRRLFGVPGDASLIGCAGSFTAEKGHLVLIRGFQQINRMLPQSRLMLIGDGPLKEKYVTLVRRLGLDGKIVFPGFLSDLGAVLPSLDLFIFPSLEEGLGSSLLYAMACGIPVCASRTGGIPEVIEQGRTGYLFAPGDTDSLVNSALEAIGNPGESRQLAEAASRSVCERFSVERTVEQTHTVYTNVLAT
jgi:glycosyltransferase involved in cell wall biosynthesis